jgi:Protein of unknown function (DUF2568)
MAESGALTAANLALRFALELAALAALAYWGFHTGKTAIADVVLGLGAPLVAAAVWGVFAAPSSARRLRGGALVAVQSAVFAAAAIALVAAGQPVLAVAFAVVVAVNSVLLHVLGDEWPGTRS